MSDETTREPGEPGDGNAACRVITVAGKGKDKYSLAEAAVVLKCPDKWLSNHCTRGDVACVKYDGTTKAGHKFMLRYIDRAEMARLAAETPLETSGQRAPRKARQAATKAVAPAPAKRRAVIQRQADAAAKEGYPDLEGVMLRRQPKAPTLPETFGQMRKANDRACIVQTCELLRARIAVCQSAIDALHKL